MSITGAIVVYVIAWWLVFFTVLPIGVQGQHETGEVVDGTEPGAPVEHNLKQKAIWASMGAAVVLAVFLAVVFSGIFVSE